MPCYNVPIGRNDANGRPIVATVCSRGSGIRRKRCVGCRQLCDRLCDVFVAGRARNGDRPTCSAPVCTRCSIRLGDDTDVCPSHPVPDEALASPGGRP